MPKKLTIIVTHGALLTTRLLAKTLQDKDNSSEAMQLIIGYADGQYKLDGEIIDFPSYLETFKRTHEVDDDAIRVCCDANLGEPAGPNLTSAAHELIRETQANEVILFSSTEGCNLDAKNYVQRRGSHRGLELPDTVTRCLAGDRTELGNLIRKDDYITKPLPTFEELSVRKSSLLHSKAVDIVTGAISDAFNYMQRRAHYSSKVRHVPIDDGDSDAIVTVTLKP